MRRVLSLALIASLVFTTNAFSADAKKSAHPKHHAKGAQTQHHVSVPKAHQSGHKSATNKNKSHAHKHVQHV